MMPPLPPINASSTASSSARAGDFFGAPVTVDFGDWASATGSGQASATGKINWVWLAAGGAALWFVMRKKG